MEFLEPITIFFPIIQTIIVPLLAIYGSILSTLVFLDNRKKEKPQIEITWNLDLDWENGEPKAAHNKIIAMNIGVKPVTFASAFIEEYIEPPKPWEKWVRKADRKEARRRSTDPVKFEKNNKKSYGESLDVEIHYQDLDRTFGRSPDMKVIAVFIDQIGNRYQSKKPFSLQNIRQ